MISKQKRANQKRAATLVAEIMMNSLDQFPEAERKKRLKEIHSTLQSTSNDRGKPSKRPANVQNRRQSRLSSAHR